MSVSVYRNKGVYRTPDPPPIVEVYGGSGLCCTRFALGRFVVKCREKMDWQLSDAQTDTRARSARASREKPTGAI